MMNDLVNVLSNYEKLNHRNHKKDDNHLNKHAMHLIRLYLMCLDILEKEDVRFLINQTTEFQKKDTVIKIAGISNEAKGYDYWAKEKLAGFWEQEGYKLVLSHFPDLYYEKLKEAELDLALAGHYHGGMIRIPGVGGLFHPEEGFFPEYSGGLYALTKGTLIVSRGIGGHGWIPRVNNRPELVVIELTQKPE